MFVIIKIINVKNFVTINKFPLKAFETLQLFL